MKRSNTYKLAAAVFGSMLLAGCARQQVTQEQPIPLIRETPVVLMSNQSASADDAVPAAGTTAPTTKPSLPAGHPDIAAMQNESRPALPPGHPPMPGGMPGATPGGMPGGMPSGHPDISKMRGESASGKQVPKTLGAVNVRAVQSTRDAPAIGAGDVVTIESFSQGGQIGKFEGELADGGVLAVPGVPLGGDVSTVVRINHAGVEYEADVPQYDGKNPVVEAKVPVYETTDAKPDWSIQMRHVIAQPGEGKLHVMEVIAINNPSDRAWTGAARADGKKAAFTLPLPAGATDVDLISGFRDTDAIVADGVVTETRAMAPGATQYRIAYTIPITNGTVELATTVPAATKAMMVVIPDQGFTLSGSGLEGPNVIDMGGNKTALFKGQDLPAGQQVRVTIGGVSNAPASAATSSDDSADASDVTTATPAAARTGVDTSQFAKTIGGAGAVLVVLFGLSFVLLKPGKAKAAR